MHSLIKKYFLISPSTIFDPKFGEIQCNSLNAVHAPSCGIEGQYEDHMHRDCIKLRDRLMKKATRLEERRENNSLTQLPIEKLWTPAIRQLALEEGLRLRQEMDQL